MLQAGAAGSAAQVTSSRLGPRVAPSAVPPPLIPPHGVPCAAGAPCPRGGWPTPGSAGRGEAGAVSSRRSGSAAGTSAPCCNQPAAAALVLYILRQEWDCCEQTRLRGCCIQCTVCPQCRTRSVQYSGNTMENMNTDSSAASTAAMHSASATRNAILGCIRKVQVPAPWGRDARRCAGVIVSTRLDAGGHVSATRTKTCEVADSALRQGGALQAARAAPPLT